MSLDDLPLEVVLDELASTYETVAALPPVVPDPGGRKPGKPGSRVPPGVTEIIDADEHDRAVAEVDSWAEFVAHVLIDEEPGIGKVPDHTPGRLRLAARWADRIENHPDEMLRYALCFDAVEHLRMMRRLARRHDRVVRTGSPCLVVTCPGTYEAVIDGPGFDGDLVCSNPACRDRVGHEQWSRWGARSEWVTVERAARLLNVSEDLVRQWAKRRHWRRKGEGRNVRYKTEDVTGKNETEEQSA
ncbi:helix-turn-helix domain-containing protein [Georgenia sp. TF02-10]|uniref:helix-turn-helix domain-containing protein n=1 Tax=Georgenia sp. TF02-10 TaxID=2917725 RepID=UPI001FA7B398|nr:helix-turn-helix domain-containing protein [Georgenia sp. TF02-10]UNX54096.1 helix-turn-helix domain-containing protein [Georgenia sp. TF02-10]